MIHAYDKLYLSVAQKNLACMLDYMVNDLKRPLETVWQRTDRKSTWTELEDEQPHQRRHGYLRRFRDRGNRAGHRGDRYGHCLWPLRNVFI